MIGNDLIDLRLALAEKKSTNSRFLNKIFTRKEICFIKNSVDPELGLWKLWSMKETAYKANQRIFKLQRKLNPFFYECYDISEKTGKVLAGNKSYTIKTEITKEYIHSSSAEQKTNQYIFKNEDPVKDLFLSIISHHFKITKDKIQLQKNYAGVPSIIIKYEEKRIPFSMSHHGSFTAFVIPLINS